MAAATTNEGQNHVEFDDSRVTLSGAVVRVECFYSFSDLESHPGRKRVDAERSYEMLSRPRRESPSCLCPTE